MRVYLDHNATAPLDERVLDAMLPWLRRHHGNPSSLHREGREARRAVEDAREQVGRLLEGDARSVVFTSGATEANNLALRGLLADGRRRLLVSAVEHPSVLAVAKDWARKSGAVVHLPVDRNGRLELGALDEVLEGPNDVVAVMAANNEVGTLQPWADVAARCREVGAALHVDAVQVAGKLPFEVPDPGVGTVALSAHKMGGPKGVGCLWVRQDTRIAPQLLGGEQERLRRAGTENVAGIVGFGHAAEFAREEASARSVTLGELESGFLVALSDQVGEIVVQGPGVPARLPGTLSLRIPGIAGEPLLLGCDLEGVSISLGSACSSGAVQPSHVLKSMGVGKVENLESFRVSLGWRQTADEVSWAAAAIARVVERNRRCG